MGSKTSKLKPGTSDPQAKADKEEMKEPENYYSHRSKSMRRKAGRTPGGSGPNGEPGQSGVTGGGVV